MEHDVNELIGKVAEQNGIRLDHDDPAFALVTLNELVLKTTADHLRREIQSTVDSFADSVQRLEARAGAVLAHEVTQATADVRRHLATDLHAAGGAGDLSHADFYRALKPGAGDDGSYQRAAETSWRP